MHDLRRVRQSADAPARESGMFALALAPYNSALHVKRSCRDGSLSDAVGNDVGFVEGGRNVATCPSVEKRSE
jgi:hypothetical protein